MAVFNSWVLAKGCVAAGGTAEPLQVAGRTGRHDRSTVGEAGASFRFAFTVLTDRGCFAHGTGEVKAGLDPFC